MFSWDFFLLHPLCWQLLEKLSKTRTQIQGADTFAGGVTVENLDNSNLVTHKPERWALGGLQEGPGHDRDAEGPPLGIPSQEL